MKHNLDTLISKLQHQIHQIDAEAEAWKAQNEEKLKTAISSQTAEISPQLKQLKAQLADLESKRSTIKKYYVAYYDEASPSVQKSTSCQPVPVNMNLFKNQLVNPNHKQAADTIVTMARSNLEFLKNQEADLKEQIEALEGGISQASKKLELLDVQVKSRYEKKYLEAVMSSDLLYLNDQWQQMTSDYQEDDWESFVYESPAFSREQIMIGSALYDLKVPDYLHHAMAMFPSWKDNCIQVPVCLPMNGFHMLVNYHVSQAMITREGIRTLIGNLLKHMPAGSVRVYPMDLETFNGAAFGGLIKMVGSSPAFMAPVPANEDQLLKTLKEIYNDAVKVSQKMTGYRTLDEYNADAPDGEQLTRKVIVAYGCPERLSSKALEYFERIYYMSAQCGISIVAVHNSNSDMLMSSAKTFYQNMAGDALVIDCSPEGQYVVSGKNKAPLRWLRGLHALSEETVEAVRDAYGSAAPAGAGAENQSIDDCFKKIKHTRGNRRLSLAFGTDEENQVKKFAFEEMNFAAYISGSAGCGKSSLMHTLIAGILLNYHPEDIELWLVDFKMTEFQVYAKHMPPHVKRVILESSEEVVLDLIDELTEILDKRTKLFSKYGLKDMIHLPEEFRKKHLPLIIVMVDEFATMTQIIRNAPMSANLTYAEKLENLLAKGRALGFRFIFADQAYEAGVHGLTAKAKNQIGQRFAMANVSQEEIRGTLALPGAATEEVKQWMATLPPFHTLTSEKEGVEGTLENVVRVHRSKVAFVPQDRIIEITKELNKQYKPVGSSKELTDNTYMDKNPLVIDGQRVYTFKECEADMEAWDVQQDYPDEIQRLYLGRPCALRQQSPVELKPAPGENLLMIAETPDIVASELLSSIGSLKRQNAKITILADPLDPFYRKYRRRWEMYDCITDLEEICGKIIQLRQQVEKNLSSNELVIMLGVYNMYQQWEELPKRKTAVKAKGNGGSDFSAPDVYSVKPVEMTGKPSALVSQLGIVLEPEDTDDDDDLDIEGLLSEDPLFDDLEDISGSGSDSDTESNETDGLLYNAIEDFRWLLIKAPARGIHFLVVLSQFSEYKEMKWAQKMFRHLVYQWLAKDELAEIIGFGRSARIPGGAVRYVSKKDAFSLRPYLWPALTINGWTMDENGIAVEAGDEDDEFI